MKTGWLLRYVAPLLLIAGLLASAAIAYWRHVHDVMPVVQCRSLPQACQFALQDGRLATLAFKARPSGLHPFTVQVGVPQAKVVTVRFTMRDMDMGDIRYRLRRQSAAVWQTEVVLPVCVSGQHDWLLTLTVDGHAVRIPFSG